MTTAIYVVLLLILLMALVMTDSFQWLQLRDRAKQWLTRLRKRIKKPP